MQSLVFVCIAVLILVPIIYILPLGLSRRGKNMMVVASLLLSLFGLLSIAILPMWQTILLEVLLIGGVTYFMSKRTETLLAVEVEEEATTRQQNEPEQVLDQLSDMYKHIALSDKTMKKGVGEEIPEHPQHPQMKLSQAIETSPNSTLPVKQKDDELSIPTVEKDLSEFENRDLTVSLEEVNEQSGTEADKSDHQNYLAEIEEYLIVDEDDSFDKNRVKDNEDELEELYLEPLGSEQGQPEPEPERNLAELEEELEELDFEDKQSKKKTPEKAY